MSDPTVAAPVKYRQSSLKPPRKITVGGVTGALTAIAVWIVNEFDLLPGGRDIPGEIASAITTVLTFAMSYFVSPAPEDTIIRDKAD